MTEPVLAVVEFKVAFKTPFTAGAVIDANFPLRTGLDDGGSRLRCNFGAMLTSVFVVRSKALPFGGSRLAITPLNPQNFETRVFFYLLTLSRTRVLPKTQTFIS